MIKEGRKKNRSQEGANSAIVTEFTPSQPRNTAPFGDQECIVYKLTRCIMCEDQEGHKIDQAILVVSTCVKMVLIDFIIVDI